MTETRKNLTDERLLALVEPAAEELGLECYDARVNSGQQRSQVILTVDRIGSTGKPGTGVTIQELTEMTREVHSLLVLEMGDAFDFRLEVTSPGLERVLRTPRDFKRQVGDRVRIVMSEPDGDGRSVVEGELQSADDDSVTVSVAEDETVVVPYAQIRRAKTLFDFGPPKHPKAKGGGRAKQGGTNAANKQRKR